MCLSSFNSICFFPWHCVRKSENKKLFFTPWKFSLPLLRTHSWNRYYYQHFLFFLSSLYISVTIPWLLSSTKPLRLFAYDWCPLITLSCHCYATRYEATNDCGIFFLANSLGDDDNAVKEKFHHKDMPKGTSYDVKCSRVVLTTLRLLFY